MHKHEWRFNWEDYYAVCKDVDCPRKLFKNRMGTDEMERRINATEEISAKDARRILRLHAANENDDMWILNAYAERMEGG